MCPGCAGKATQRRDEEREHTTSRKYFTSISFCSRVINHRRKMTTRSRQKLSSILAVFSIIALLLLLVFVWTAVRNGVFSNGSDMKAHGSYRLRPFNPSDSTTIQSLDEHSSKHHGHYPHHPHHRHNESTTLHGKFTDTFISIRQPVNYKVRCSIPLRGDTHSADVHCKCMCAAHGNPSECDTLHAHQKKRNSEDKCAFGF